MIFKPWILIPTGLAHRVSPFFLNLIYPLYRDKKPNWDEFQWKNLKFPNRVGIAGGVDKNARNLQAWTEIGYGFLEVGTVTPRPQGPNPGKTVGRIWSQKILWNKLGFPNQGLLKIKERLEAFANKKRTPVFVNIGKNRDTPISEASEDYITCIRELHHVADAFVVNISSPNTKDLRELLKKENLKTFLSPIVKIAKIFSSPVLLKLSPDMEDADIKNVIEISLELDLQGWVLTNSTIEKPMPDPFPEGGGITGLPLKEKSRNFLKRFMTALGNRKDDRLVVSVGGILDVNEMRLRLEMGADLVQVYSALIFHGPGFVKILSRTQS